MKRIAKWESALSEFLASRKNIPYAWGTTDCCMFSADAILTITGTDIAAEFRGTYSDEAGAYAAIKRVCDGTSAEDAVKWCAEKYGMPARKGPLYAQRGDLLLISNGGKVIAGIVDMHGQAAAVTETGLFSFSIKSVVAAYQV